MASNTFNPTWYGARLFRRCVQCPETAPTCPACPDGQVCSQTVESCDQCASTTCVPAVDQPTDTGDGGPSGAKIGGIVGGVIGGVAFLAVLIYLFWRFYPKGRRQKYDEGKWVQVDVPPEKSDDYTMRRDARASTHTVASMASTILTRASNVIQIAYIPGVRSGPANNNHPGSDSLLVPPVPPIPIPTTPSTNPGSPYSNQDQHFFVPDLRDSTYSGFSDGDRSSFARTSIAPSLARSSVATAKYRVDAVVPMPAQTIMRGKAAMVSVKGSNNNSPNESPAIGSDANSSKSPTPNKGAATAVQVQMPHSSDGPSNSRSPSVRSIASFARPVPLNITKKKSSNSVETTSTGATSSTNDSTKTERANTERVPVGLGVGMRPLTEVSVTESEDSVATHSRARQSDGHDIVPDSDSDGEESSRHDRARRSLLGNDNTSSFGNATGNNQSRFSDVTSIADTPYTPYSAQFSPAMDQNSPQSPPRLSMAIGSPSRGDERTLSTVMEEASERRRGESRGSDSSSVGDSPGADIKRGTSPFGDENAVSR
ncbi:hypothetical protein BDY21DRAFT_370869 [Lineolata rhizophorae]|uniref:Membrane anchor Opy2 N-terminal domain-containing protein n=1 Tax=Lineolata rhizophorae TaxID=578093 RepID=A0A6A6P4K2_9PEZI|nr:hypothetical protein BDY21DRAFT_370869 [Lineolata rhizophorae]